MYFLRRQIFDTVERYAPGFKKSVIDYEVLPPPDLEKIFGLTGGVSSYLLCVHLSISPIAILH